ncbi:hypothetical protein C8J57DRAFT_1229234 [Mycena rebaudengoi]|nr:hypothetical protein C8J57DRAFT_1229234 [Mycena rebaudengoi]
MSRVVVWVSLYVWKVSWKESPVDVWKWFLGEEFGGLWVMLPHLVIRNGAFARAYTLSDLTGINNGMSSAFPPPPQESFKFDDDNLRLMTQEEMDAAGEAWQWVPSDTIWLDKDVSSDVYIPLQPFPVTKNFKVVQIKRIHGIPSQFLVPRVPTVYIVDFSSVQDTYKDEDGKMRNLDKILKDKTAHDNYLDCHSWDRTPGEREKNRAPMVNGQLFASIGHFAFIQRRWSQQFCQGILYCQSIDLSLINVECYKLDPHMRDAVNNAQIMHRLDQGSCTFQNTRSWAVFKFVSVWAMPRWSVVSGWVETQTTSLG